MFKLDILIKLLLLSSAIFGCSDGTAYNILMLTSPFGSHSHSIFLESIGRELASRGHKIVHRCIGDFEKFPGISHHVFDPHFVENVNDIGTHIMTIDSVVNETYHDPLLAEIVRQPMNPVSGRPKYDVMVVDELLSEIYLPVAHHMGIPSVLVAISLSQLSGVMWNLNIPLPWSYYNPLGFPEPLDLFQRTKSVLSNLETLFWLNLFRYPMMGVEIRRLMPNTPGCPHLIRNASFILVNTHPPIQERLPTMPYKAEIGCPQCTSPRPLPKELNDVVSKAGDAGFIYFSMGNFLKSGWPLDEFKGKLVKVLSKLPQTVLWRDEVDLVSVPRNFRPVKWVPQQDLLGHPKLRLMIGNGGMMSMHEAAYHAVPILGFPYHQDQYQAMQNAKRIGFGEFLDWKEFKEQELRQIVIKMVNDKKYKLAAAEASILMKDRPHTPLNVSAHWIEYVVRHEGAYFLKSEADNLYWFQYFMLDCVALILVILAAVLVFVWYIIIICYKILMWLFRKPPTPDIREKKKN